MPIDELTGQFPNPGKLIWIGLRPGRKQPLLSVSKAEADPDHGLIGDRYQSNSGTRHVTLFQQEHLVVLESFTRQPVSAAMLRRNLLVSGINLLALKQQQFCIGAVVFQTTGLCHPCSRMEAVLGPGGYNALRGHGGITARVVKGGMIRVGDQIMPLPAHGYTHPMNE